MTSERWLTPIDLKLLRALGRTPNLVRAARAVGITRDRAVYRIARLRRLYGRAAAVGRRGGGALGSTTLTKFGRALLRPASPPPARFGMVQWTGIYRGGPSPHVDLPGGRRIVVAFRARPGSSVALELDPETVIVSRTRFESSARNVLRVRIVALRAIAAGRVALEARWDGLPIRAIVTPGSAARLGLAPGRNAFFYVKAVAVRRA